MIFKPWQYCVFALAYVLCAYFAYTKCHSAMWAILNCAYACVCLTMAHYAKKR